MNKKAKIFSFIFIILLLYLFVFIFILLFNNFYNTKITGKIAFFPREYSKLYLEGEQLEGILRIELKKGNNVNDLIPADATFEIYVDNKSIANYSFAELVALSNQAGKGNFTYGVFRNANPNGFAPAQKGWGFSVCSLSPPKATLAAYAAYPDQPTGKFLEKCTQQGAQREIPCPDGINTIQQTCQCFPGIGGGQCYWQPTIDTACVTKYSCENFNNVYEINLSKLDIPVQDRDGDGNVNIKFRLVYRWQTPWNYADDYCTENTGVSQGMVCNMSNYAATWDPVCGVDNVTYPNACFARCQGTTEVDCQGECPCPTQPPTKPKITYAAQSQPSKPIKEHEVEILSNKISVPILTLPSIDCEWNYTCHNSKEYNRTQKVWMEYSLTVSGSSSKERCIAALCTLNPYHPDCTSLPPNYRNATLFGNIKPIKILNNCSICFPTECPTPQAYRQAENDGITLPQTWRFSIYRCNYKESINRLKTTSSITRLLPDTVELDGDVDDFIRDCVYGCSGNRCASSGGGGGNGGGSNVCFPWWSCSPWSECKNGRLNRTCVDLNNCSLSDINWWISIGCQGNPECISAAQRPNEFMPCNIPCEEDWSCSEWSPCDAKTGLQVRKCIDLNNCGTTYNKPQERRSCQLAYQPVEKKIVEKKQINWWKYIIPLLIGIIVLAGIIIGVLVARRKPSQLGEEIFKEEKSKKEIPQELLAYIKKALNLGASRQEIEAKLKAAGWPQDLINATFEQASSS